MKIGQHAKRTAHDPALGVGHQRGVPVQGVDPGLTDCRVSWVVATRILVTLCSKSSDQGDGNNDRSFELMGENV